MLRIRALRALHESCALHASLCVACQLCDACQLCVACPGVSLIDAPEFVPYRFINMGVAYAFVASTIEVALTQLNHP